MMPHGVPSGGLFCLSMVILMVVGDWGLQRMGAVFLEGTTFFSMSNCLMTRGDRIEEHFD